MSADHTSDKPTDEGKRRIERWLAAQRDVERAQSALESARCEMANAVSSLGGWMCPSDIKDGEMLCVWYGDSLIAVTKKGQNTYDIVVRRRGESLR